MTNKILFILFFAFTYVSAQVVTIPQYPAETDSIRVIFDKSKGGAGLIDYTGIVYAHTGVITNLSGGQWAHVIGSWGNNTVQPKLTQLDSLRYELKIGYPRTFYSVTNNNEKILKLAFVFRSADGSQQTEDLFADVFQPGLTIVTNNPKITVEFGDPLRSPAFAMQGDTLAMDIYGVTINTQISSVKLYIDNNLVAQSNQNQLYYNFIAANYSVGIHNASVIAAAAGETDTLNFILYVNPPVVNAPLPAGVIPGINIHANYSVTFALFAPYKKFVYLLSSLNDWKVNENYYFQKHEVTPDSVIWHLTINGVTPGSEKLFQYFVDGTIRIADPYSEKVLDPWNDQNIPPATYPNLIPYPAGKTNYPVTAFQTGVQPYQWQTTNFVRPAKTDLVIYELLIRDFLAAHDFKTLKDTLMYLKNLGVNAIELMPVNEFEGNESWGYNPSFYFAVDKYYGPAEDLKKFIDFAHQNGIAVIADMVLNHSYGQSPLVRLYFSGGKPALNNPWYNRVSPNQVFNWGYDFNHESIHTKNFVDRVNKYWLTEFKVDGFRFDFTKGFTNRPGDGSSHDASRISILTRMANQIFAYDSTIYVILEHFAPNSEEIILANNGMMLWGNVNYQYNEATMGYSSDLSGASYTSRGWTKPHLVAYMESHDEERLMFRNLQYGNSLGGYNIKDFRVALNRIKLAAAFFFTIPGPKMIWQFGELGYDISIDYPCRVCNKPIKWEYFLDARRSNVYKVFAALIKLRTEYEAFRSTNFSYDLSSYMKRIKIMHSSMNVVIIGNFGVSTGSISPQFPSSGTWYDYFSGDSIAVGDPSANRMLEPGEFHIYTNVRLPAPEQGILLENDDAGTGIPESFNMEQNYPNPFNPETSIRYSIAEQSKVSIKIFDTLGREIKTLVDEEVSPGTYEVNFNAGNLTSGVYFCKMEAGTYISTKKMILLK